MSTRYQYVAINNNQYYYLRQNPVALAWFLYFKSKPLRLRSAFKTKRIIRTVKTLIQHQLHWRKNGTILELPIYGNLCLRVHRGYRIFNYSQNIVIRIMDPDVDTAIVVSEIQGVRSASQLDFAPRILRWNIEEHWYEEEMVNGYIGYSIPKSDSATLLKMYHQDVVSHLEQMISMQPPVKTTVGAIIKRCVDVLEDGRLSNADLDVTKVDAVRRFSESIITQLCPETECQIELVFSHGDFSLRNMVSTKEGLIVVDWESTAYRSTLFDFYNFFFTELYYQRVSTNLVSEINEAILSLQSRLMSSAPEPAKTLLPLKRIYRHLYYLERVCTLLDRDLKNELLDVILRSIAVFNRYEEIGGN